MTKPTLVLYAGLLAASVALSACTHATVQSASAPPQAPATETRAAVPELAHTSIPELERLVAQGDIKAHVELGSRYGLGAGVERNYGKAIELIQVAADRGDAVAQFFLGTAYYHGAGVPKDDATAVLWTDRAAAQGLAIAEYWMGVYVATGTGGVAKSTSGAMPYFWQAAVQGDSLAAFTLGQLYNKDPNVDRNVKAAAYWYRRASIPTLNQQAYLELAFLLKNKEVEWQPGDPVLPPATAPDAAINATP